MKLITLNIWGGHVREPLLKFIGNNLDIDVFCLQEVYHNATDRVSTDEREVSLNIFGDLHRLLPNHIPFFRPVVQDVYGIGMFVKKGIKVVGEGEEQIYDNPEFTGLGPKHPRNLQWLKCKVKNKAYSIVNVHGLWNGMGKTDTDDRLAQSQKIRDFMDTLDTPKILCGDFNLTPDTQSLKIIEDGMINQIRKNNIKSTRSIQYYPKPERFADYIFTSPDIVVHDFKVLPDEVSDHLPLFLDFD
ncbi:MAG TPA: endonuclease/exonuclease/phosphatase family protein [Aquella sp.]|nr:endonuclease/exonuclease/phosphatase family protein [Aquella sp.]